MDEIKEIEQIKNEIQQIKKSLKLIHERIDIEVAMLKEIKKISDKLCETNK